MAVKIFRKDIFVTALLIVAFIFLIGIYLGSKLDTFRVDRASEMVDEAGLDLESFVVQSDFYSGFLGDSCASKRESFDSLGQSLGKIGGLLVDLDKMKLAGSESYENLRRKYFLMSIRAYILKKGLVDNCGDKGNLILYFYDTSENEESLRQGYVLDDIVRKRDVMVFSIDRGFSDDALDAVKSYYGVTKGPTVIVNFKTKKEGFVSLGELVGLLE